MDTIQMQEQPQQPQGKRTVLLAGVILLAAAAIAASFFVVLNVRANADYICTYIIEEAGECTNGGWSDWTVVSTTPGANECAISKVEKRTYTGVRTTQHILQYLNRRTSCNAGYTQELGGNSGGASGFHGGSIFSQSVSCQVEETRVTRAPGTGPTCGTTQVTSIGSDTGEGSFEGSQQVSSEEDLNAFRVSMIDASIFARPGLVRMGETTLVKWQGREVTSCTVTGSNGDSWTGTSGEQTSGSIIERTTYTLNCVAFNGTPVTDQAVVDIVPVFEEN